MTGSKPPGSANPSKDKEAEHHTEMGVKTQTRSRFRATGKGKKVNFLKAASASKRTPMQESTTRTKITLTHIQHVRYDQNQNLAAKSK